MTLATTRDLDHRVFAGVCAGFASAHQYPVSAVRAAAVLLGVATAGLGGVAYLALWRILPATGDSGAPTLPTPAEREADPPETTLEAAPEPTSPTSQAATHLATTPGSRSVSPELQRLYGPVADDLPLVSEKIQSIAQAAEFAFLQKMLAAALAGTGKMMRPAIALAGGRLGDYNLDRLVPLAASVELLHTATLVHDDVIDEAETRRGEQTPNALFGNAASVMLGDYMFAHAADFIAQTDNPKVVRLFAKTLMTLASGELTQDITVFEYSEDVTRYLDRITGKTASLFGTAAQGGAMAAGAAPEYCEAMRLYGVRLGIAFQIVDDILDFTGDPEVMGKPVGSDLHGGTLTLPAILYMQQRSEDNPIRKAFEGVRRKANLDRAIREILESDVIEESRRTARQFGDQALEALAPLPEGEVKATLAGLVDYVLERNT
jgi:geranylgeranyl pyrophosphate synthase/phage shock protein PspC (stress-responsive transcriptional regulator)